MLNDMEKDWQILAYLKDVLAQRRCVPFTRYYGGIGRTGQAK